MSFYDYDVILEIALVKNQHQIQILNVNADGEGLKNITMNNKDTKKKQNQAKKNDHKRPKSQYENHKLQKLN